MDVEKAKALGQETLASWEKMAQTETDPQRLAELLGDIEHAKKDIAKLGTTEGVKEFEEMMKANPQMVENLEKAAPLNGKAGGAVQPNEQIPTVTAAPEASVGLFSGTRQAWSGKLSEAGYESMGRVGKYTASVAGNIRNRGIVMGSLKAASAGGALVLGAHGTVRALGFIGEKTGLKDAAIDPETGQPKPQDMGDAFKIGAELGGAALAAYWAAKGGKAAAMGR